MLMKFTWFGINVICTAGMPDDTEGWSITKPYLIGKAYPSLLSGYFDFIGYVEKDMSVDTGYPPTVQFEETAKLKAKCGDTRLAGKGGTLDWTSIFELLNSDNNNNNDTTKE